MVDDVGAAVVSTVSPKRPATAKPAAEVEAADAAGDVPTCTGGPQTKMVDQNRISVDHLRGTGGAQFEGKVAVLRGAREKNRLAKLLPCVFGERDFVSYGEVLRYVVIKGDSCFIFTEESDPSPLYAIPLHDKTAKREDPNNPEVTSLTISPTFKNIAKEDLETVLLKYRCSGKVAYQFTFNQRDGSNLADGFLGVVNSLSKSGGKVGDKTSSVVYAQVVAAEKGKYQPTDLNQS